MGSKDPALSLRGERLPCQRYYSRLVLIPLLKKNQNTPRPSEHPPVMGEKMSKRLGGIKRLQIQNLFMTFKQVPRCRQHWVHSIMSGRNPPLYCTFTLIAKANQRQCSTPLHMVVVIYITKAISTKPLHDILTGFPTGSNLGLTV